MMSLDFKRKRRASEDEEDTGEYDSSAETKKQKIKSGRKFWALEDQIQLLKNVHAVLPKNDIQRYLLGTKRLNWPAIAFDNYTEEECKMRLQYIIERARRFQTLTELVESASNLVRKRPNLFRDNYIDLPKRPLSSYFLFLSDYRERIKSNHPDLRTREMQRLLTDKFHKLSEKKKAKYNKKFKAAKEEYIQKMVTFKKDHPEYDDQHKEMFFDAPKMPTPVFLYMERKIKDMQNSNPELSADELKSQCRELWTNLKNKRKLKWIKKAAAAWPQFVEEMDMYCKENPNYIVRFHSLFTQEEQRLKDKADGKPEKPARNGFYLFKQEAMEEGEDSLQLISSQWKSLTNIQRQNYSHKAKEAQAEYNTDYAEYRKHKEDVDYAIGRKSSRGSSSDSPQVNEDGKQSRHTALKSEDAMNDDCNDDLTDCEQEPASNMQTEYSDDNEDEKTMHNSKQLMMTDFIDGKKLQNGRKLPKSFPNEPTRPVKSAYQLFCKELLSTMTNVPNNLRMQEIAEQWKEVTPEQRAEMKHMVEKQKHKYTKKLDQFKQTLSADELELFEKIIEARKRRKV